jgi:SDR family mycofactocin-dependent oxidoreductase
MMPLNGKVAFITGAARGQGRSHALTLARMGAAIVGMDICEQIPTVFYSMATRDDLDETARLVREEGGRIVTHVGDVGNRNHVQQAYDLAIAEFGSVDILLANAGIMPVIGPGEQKRAWHDGVNTMLTGVWNCLDVVTPGMVERGNGGAVVITSSSAGLSSLGISTNPGQAAYSAAKHGVVGLMRLYASQLGEHHIRVNTVHPCGVNTLMVNNSEFQTYYNEHPELTENSTLDNAMPVSQVEPEDVSNAIAFLVSDSARYITGVALPVDAGFLVR